MALSRMYLGRHYLADVLGGLVVGAMTVGSTAALLRWIEKSRHREHRVTVISLSAVLVLALVALASCIGQFNPPNVGRLVGLFISYIVLNATGFPPDGGTLRSRGLRLMVAVLIYVVLDRTLSWTLAGTSLYASRLGSLLVAAITVSSAFLCSVSLGRYYRWYQDSV
jgi:hypothetical protein